MANAEEQRRLDDLISDVNFPMPEADDLDLDFDFDFSAKDVTNAGTGLPAVPDEYMLDHQYGAVAALATQGAVVRPVSDVGVQPFQQDWQMLQQGSWDPRQTDTAYDINQSSSSGAASAAPAQKPWQRTFELANSQPAMQSQPDMEQFSGGILPSTDIQQQQQQQQQCTNGVLAGQEPGASSGDTKSGDLDAKARAERTKAKNQRAQKKFRQKQKEKHKELEKSAAELSAKLKTTLAEIDVLQNQKKILEIAMSRDIKARETSTSAKQEPEEPVFVPAQGFERFSSKAGILLEVLFDPPRKLTHEQALRLSLKDHARIWKEQCRQASELLKNGASDMDSPSGKKLRVAFCQPKAVEQALMNERHGLLAWTCVNNPVIMHKLMTSKLVDPPVTDHEPPGSAFWQRILEAMKFTPDQQNCLLEARTVYLTEVSRLLEERRALQTTLKGLDTGFKTNLGDKARTHVLWAEAVRALQENVDAFHICHCVFMVTVYNHARGFTVVQEASLMVQSFPHAPDVFALLRELAVLTGQPAAPNLSERAPSQSIARQSSVGKDPYVSLVDKLESAITAVNRDFVEKLG